MTQMDKRIKMWITGTKSRIESMKIDAVYGCVSSSNVFSRDKVSRYSFLSLLSFFCLLPDPEGRYSSYGRGLNTVSFPKCPSESKC